MSIKLSEEKYKELKKQAQQANKKLNIENLTPNEKDEIVEKNIREKHFENEEMKEIFIANFLIPDDQKFYQTYLDNGKSIQRSAEELKVSEKVVFTRVFELGKYSSYIRVLKDKKGADSMKEIEIIDNLSLASLEEANTDDSALQVISKINMLMEANNHKDKTIDSQQKTIDKLNNDIDSLKKLNNEQNETINSLDSINTTLKKQISDQEIKIQQFANDIKILLKYKANFEKVVGFISKNDIKAQNIEKK